MIYYYHLAKTGKPQLKITTDSMNLEINVGMWFPNTKAKVKQLLTIMKENKWDCETQFAGALAGLVEDLRLSYTFKDREVKNTKMFCKMLNSNIEQIRIFAGLYC